MTSAPVLTRGSSDDELFPPMEGFCCRLVCDHELDSLHELHELVADGLGEPSLYRRSPKAFFARHLGTEGVTLGVYRERTIVGFALLRFPGLAADNLGRDLDLSGGQLPCVAHLEECAVHPSMRGHGLQSYLIERRTELAARRGYRHLLSTIAPRNIPSLKSHLKHGAQVAWLGEKYGGDQRFIVHRDLEQMSDSLDHRLDLPLDDLDLLRRRLLSGLRGYGLVEGEDRISLRLGRLNRHDMSATWERDDAKVSR